MLKGIDPLLPGELLKLLDEMGHGDQLIIADRNFPGFSQGIPVVRLDTDAATAIRAILTVFPLDTFVEHPLERMGPQDDPASEENDTHRAVLSAARAADPRPLELGVIPRFDFYDRAKSAFAVVLTRESAPYADFVLSKGVL